MKVFLLALLLTVVSAAPSAIFEHPISPSWYSNIENEGMSTKSARQMGPAENSKPPTKSERQLSPDEYYAAMVARSGEQLDAPQQTERFLLQNVTQLIGIVQSAVKQELSSTINILNQLKNNLTNLINQQKQTPVTVFVRDQQSSSPLYSPNYFNEPQNKQPVYILVRPAYLSGSSTRPYFSSYYRSAGSDYFFNNRRKEKKLMMVPGASDHLESWEGDDLP